VIKRVTCAGVRRVSCPASGTVCVPSGMMIESSWSNQPRSGGK
jgi:hypothetical protein